MKIYSVYDKEFNEYGEIVKLIDFAELLNVLHTKEAPSDGTIYVPSDDDLYADITDEKYVDTAVEIVDFKPVTLPESVWYI